VAPVAKPVPEIVTGVPPATGPDEGVRTLIFGAVFVAGPKNSAMFGALAAAPGKTRQIQRFRHHSQACFDVEAGCSTEILWCLTADHHRGYVTATILRVSIN